MNISLFLVIAVMLIGDAGLCLAEMPPELPGKDPAAESYRKAIEASQDSREKAALYKKLGDLFVAREDYKSAAPEYIHALSLSRKFPAGERMQMAVAISWGDRLDEAIAEFRALVKEDPDNDAARIHLARTLSWSGAFDESLSEIEPVLKRNPDSRDALLIKADDLRWKGKTGDALPLYRSILDKEEDFDARLGYTRALFDRGDEAAARESMALLKPAYPYQENELKKLQEEINRPKPAQPVQGEVKFTHYRDSDGNDVNRYMASFGFSAMGSKNLVSYIHTEAHDYTRRNGADMVFGEARMPVAGRIGAGAGVGIISYQGNGGGDFLFGRLNADVELPWASAGLSLSNEPVTDTAQLIENRIRVTTTRIFLSRGLTDRLFLYGSYGYADYSDSNSSHDFLLSPRFTLRENPRVNIGYRFRYLNFDRQSFGGYFDPNDFFSNQVFVNASFEAGRYFGFVELFVGEQSFRRYAVSHNDVIYGGTATMGYKLTPHISAEVTAEGGNYALQSAAGFTSFLYGFRLSGTW